MSSRKQVVTAGLLALVIAVAVIAAAAIFVPPSSKLVNTSSQVSTSQGQVSTSQASSSTSQIEANQGQLDVLLTDPPTVPDGVTAVYVTYSNVAVHVSGAGDQSGWINANTTGTIDLMKMVNVSTTIAAVKVASGVYDALRFNISSAAVTYNGKNYTAFVPQAELTVDIPGGIQVNAAKTSAAIIDMQPTVMNMGSQSDPEFIVDTAATCFQVPTSAVTNDMGHRGFTMGIGNAPWWTQISEQYTANIQITGATLTSNTLTANVENTGTETVNLRFVSLMPLGSECAPPVTTSTTTTTTTTSTSTTSTSTTSTTTITARHEHRGGQYRLPQCFTGSALFIVLNNGTLIPVSSLLPGGFMLQNGRNLNSMSFLSQTGYELPVSQSVSLTLSPFSKPITFGFSFLGRTALGVISGDQYSITVVGPQALAEYVVVATATTTTTTTTTTSS